MAILHKECLVTELNVAASRAAIAANFTDCSAVALTTGTAIVTCTDLTARLLLKADLVGGLVPVAQLPSYVSDVFEYANLAALPAAGESNKVYVTIDNNKTYRWSGSTYVEISASTTMTISDEGVALTTAATSIDVTGGGATATNVGTAVTINVPATTNTLTSAVNTLTSTVSGVVATASAVNSNTLVLTGSNLVSTINGVASAAAVIPTIAALDESVSLTSAIVSLDFVGSGVTATNTAGAITVAVPRPTSWVWDAAGTGAATLTFSDSTTLSIPSMSAPAVC
jgi:hypothetical protein